MSAGADAASSISAEESSAAAGGQSKSKNDGQSKTLNDKTNYQGDRVSFSTDIIVEAEAADQSVIGKVCLPRKWELRGGNAYTANGDGSPKTGTRFTLLKPPGHPLIPWLPRLGSSKPSGNSTACRNDLPKDFNNDLAKLLAPDLVIRVDTTQLSDNPPDRVGLAYGVLTVPLKYHLTGAKDITGSASVGPYIGYRTDNEGLGYGITLIAFLAASNISVPQAASGTSGSTSNTGTMSTQDLFGLSYGAGVVATVKRSFQLGLVLGADRVSSSANYQYNGKPWLALEIGYDFLQ